MYFSRFSNASLDIILPSYRNENFHILTMFPFVKFKQPSPIKQCVSFTLKKQKPQYLRSWENPNVRIWIEKRRKMKSHRWPDEVKTKQILPWQYVGAVSVYLALRVQRLPPPLRSWLFPLVLIASFWMAGSTVTQIGMSYLTGRPPKLSERNHHRPLRAPLALPPPLLLA